MPTNRSKRYEAAAKLVDAKKQYPLSEAIDTLKQFPAPKFDQTVTFVVPLGRRSQAVRPDGPRNLPLAERQRQAGARAGVRHRPGLPPPPATRGAEFVGMEDMIKKCQEGFQDFDVAIATPASHGGGA